MKKQKPPGDLGESRKIWAMLSKDFDLLPSDFTIMTMTCMTWDRWEQARVRLNEEGLLIEQKDGKRVLNPIAIIEKDSRLAFLRLWKALNLDAEPPLPTGRPAGGKKA